MGLRKQNPHKAWTRAAYVMMQKFGWRMEEIAEMPLSTFSEIQELMAWEAKEIERATKRN